MTTGKNTVREIYEYALKMLKSPFEARVITETVCHMEHGAVMGDGPAQIGAYSEAQEMIRRRIGGEPLQYIIGCWEFMGLTFRTPKGVLIPRQDTELICEKVIDMCMDKELVVYDLCAGSGCIGIAISKLAPGTRVYAFEKEDIPFSLIEENNIINGTSVISLREDVLNPSNKFPGEKADIIVSNPPYLTHRDMENLQEEVRHEPTRALYGGRDGLEFYRGIPKIWHDALKTGGHLIFEVGIGQSDDVMEILSHSGYSHMNAIRDLCGIERVIDCVKD